MQELEKILDEIELEKKRVSLSPDCSNEHAVTETILLEKIEKIILKHMNDGWIPVEERMPEDEIPTPKLVTALVPDRKARWDNSETFSLIVDTDVYDPDYMGKWEYYKKNVIAWRPLPEPYHPERSEGE